MARNGLGLTYLHLGKFDEAMSQVEQAIHYSPNSAEAHYNRSLLRLLNGDMPGGWSDYHGDGSCPELFGCLHRSRYGMVNHWLEKRCWSTASKGLAIRSSSFVSQGH